MTASLTVAWRGGGSLTIGPVETCDREPAKTGYKSHTQRTGVARDFATLTVPQDQVDREIERPKKDSIELTVPQSTTLVNRNEPESCSAVPRRSSPLIERSLIWRTDEQAKRAFDVTSRSQRPTRRHTRLCLAAAI